MRRSVLPTRWTSLLTALVFGINVLCPLSLAQAQTVLNLPLPGMMVRPTAGYNPPLLGGMVLHPENPFQFDFILQTGDEHLAGADLQTESTRLIKYFLAALTVPEDQQWVNLSPFEKDRIIPAGFDQTEMGRDMLAQDYLLKQLSASLLNPEERVGQEFWQRVYAQAAERFGTTQIPVATFNKVWIVPEQAKVYADGNVVYVLDGRLKVMLEEDYVAAGEGRSALPLGSAGLTAPSDAVSAEALAISTRIMREIVIPEIEREVNEGRTFSGLRQIFQSVILAKWYKENLRDSLLNRAYADQARLAGVDVDDPAIKDKIYQQYLQAFRQGVYNLIREDYDPAAQRKIPRRYFSGGITSLMADLDVQVTTASSAIGQDPGRGQSVLLRSRLQVPKIAEPGQPASSPTSFGWQRKDFAANAGPVYLMARTLSGLTPQQYDRNSQALSFVDPNMDFWKDQDGDAVLLFILAAGADGKLVEQLAGLQYFEPVPGEAGAARTGRRYVPGEWRGAGLDELLLAKTQAFLRAQGYRQVTLGPAVPDRPVEEVTVDLTAAGIADWIPDALIPVSFDDQARLQVQPETGETFPGGLNLAADTDDQSLREDEVIDWQGNEPLRQTVERLRADPADMEAQAILREMITTGADAGTHRQALQALVDLGDENLAGDIMTRMITQARAENRVGDALVDAFKFLLEKTGWRLSFPTVLDPSAEYAIKGLVERLSLAGRHYFILARRPGYGALERGQKLFPGAEVRRGDVPDLRGPSSEKILVLDIIHDEGSGVETVSRYGTVRHFRLSKQIFKNGHMPVMTPEEREGWLTRLNIRGRHVVIVPSVTAPEARDFVGKYEAFYSAHPDFPRPLFIVAPRRTLGISDLGLDRFAVVERADVKQDWPDLSGQDFLVLNTEGELREIMDLAAFDILGEDRGFGESVLRTIPVLFWDGTWETNRWARDTLESVGAIRVFDQQSFNEFMLNIDHLDEQRRAVQVGAEVLRRQYELVTAEMVTAMIEEVLPDLWRGMQEAAVAQPVSSPADEGQRGLETLSKDEFVDGTEQQLQFVLLSALNRKDWAAYQSTIESLTQRQVFRSLFNPDRDAMLVFALARDVSGQPMKQLIGLQVFEYTYSPQRIVQDVELRIAADWRRSGVATYLKDKVYSFLKASGYQRYETRVDGSSEEANRFHLSEKERLANAVVFGSDQYYRHNQRMAEIAFDLRRFIPPLWAEGNLVPIQFDASGRISPAEPLAAQPAWQPGRFEARRALARPYKAVVVDWDGVLQDSLDFVEDYEARALAAYLYGREGLPHEVSDLRQEVANTTSTREKFDLVWAKKTGQDREEYAGQIQEAFDAFMAPFREDFKAEWDALGAQWQGRMPLKVGARELLEYLQSQGVDVVVASNWDEELRRYAAEQMGLAGYFSAIYGGQSAEFDKGKYSKLAVLERVRQDKGARPEEILYLEDSLRHIKEAVERSYSVLAMAPNETAAQAVRDQAPDFAALLHGDFSALEELTSFLENPAAVSSPGGAVSAWNSVSRMKDEGQLDQLADFARDQQHSWLARRDALEALADLGAYDHILTLIREEMNAEEVVAAADLLKVSLAKMGWRMGLAVRGPASIASAEGLIQEMGLERRHYEIFVRGGGMTLADGQQAFPGADVRMYDDLDKYSMTDHIVFLNFSDITKQGLSESGGSTDNFKELHAPVDILKFGVPRKMSSEERAERRAAMGLGDRQVLVLGSMTDLAVFRFQQVLEKVLSDHPGMEAPVVVVAPTKPMGVAELDADPARVAVRSRRKDPWPDLAGKDFLLLNTLGELRDLYGLADGVILGQDQSLFEPVIQEVLTLFVEGDWGNNEQPKATLLGLQAIEALSESSLTRMLTMSPAERAAAQDRVRAGKAALLREYQGQVRELAVLLGSKLLPIAWRARAARFVEETDGRVGIGQAAVASSPAGREDVGGVDFNPGGFAIDQQGPGVDIPVPSSPAGWQEMDIPGLVPFIFHVAPIPDLPLFLSTQVPQAEEVLSRR